jgi:hypothetical protein
VADDQVPAVCAYSYSFPLLFREPTAEEKAEQDRRYREEQARIQKAWDRAMALLRRSLTEQQNADLNREHQFHLTGSHGGQWRIFCGTWSGNTELITSVVPGKNPGRYCAGPEDAYGLPPGDVWLAQKLAIETDERAFLKVACYYGQTPTPFQVATG